MKKSTYFILLLFIFVGQMSLKLRAASNDELFELGNSAYAKGNYKSSLQHYIKILRGGYCSKELYFNLGNVYFKLDSIPQSILYYEKAKLIDPSDEDISQNLKIANSKTTDKIDVIPQLFIVGWFQSFLTSNSLGTWSWLSILASILAAVSFISYMYLRNNVFQRLSFFGGVIFLFLCISLVFITYTASKSMQSKRAVVFTASVTLKSEPNQTATNLFVIHEGSTCRIIENLETWVRVKFDNGNEGWLQAQDIKEI